MKTFMLSAFVTLGSHLANAAVIFYGGDRTPGGLSFLHSSPTIGDTSAFYERFAIDKPMMITGLYSNQTTSSTQSRCDFEIRSGMSEGNPGTLLLGGESVACTIEPTGRHYQGFTEYQYRRTGLSLNLQPGIYFFNLRPYGGPFIGTTEGLNGIGSNVGDHFSIADSIFNSWNYSVINLDWSMGIEGEPVPEPVTLTLYGIGLTFLICNRPMRSDRTT